MTFGAPRNEERREQLRAQWGKTSVKVIAEEWGTSPGAVYRMARELGLKTQERKYPTEIKPSHRAIRERTTKYPGRIISAKKSRRALIDGGQNKKLGLRVTKGRWKGLAIYSLTGIERDSCPASCFEWATCYGNSMNWPQRLRLDAELIKRLDVELDMLAAKHPGGFLVRLHVLGDFGRDDDQAEPYVRFWIAKMIELPELHVFGFTAHPPSSLAGQLIIGLNVEFSDRWHVRFSGTDHFHGYSSLVIEQPEDSRHVVCPIETDHPKAPKSCGACGLCWTMGRPVEFVRH